MSGSVFRMFSNSSTTLRVALIDDPCGSVRSTSSSGRSELGKNCCCTNCMPARAATNSATVAPITQYFRCSTRSTAGAGSLPLDARKLDHPGPLLGFLGDELAEVGGRTREYRCAHVGEPCPDFGIG